MQFTPLLRFADEFYDHFFTRDPTSKQLFIGFIILENKICIRKALAATLVENIDTRDKKC